MATARLAAAIEIDAQNSPQTHSHTCTECIIQHAKASKWATGSAIGSGIRTVACSRLLPNPVESASCPNETPLRNRRRRSRREHAITFAYPASASASEWASESASALAAVSYPSELFAHFAIERWAARMNFAAGANVPTENTIKTNLNKNKNNIGWAQKHRVP